VIHQTKYLREFALIVLCVSFVTPSFSQKLPIAEGYYKVSDGTKIEDIKPDYSNLFSKEEIIKVGIETNFERLILFKNDPNYQKGMISIYYGDTVLLSKKMKIKARGNTRRTICDIPPLKLDVRKSKKKYGWIDKFQNIKLVMTCSERFLYDQYLLREHLVYKIYNIITDFSYNVRLMDLHLYDTQDVNSVNRQYAFIVENDKMLKKRMDLKEKTKDEINAVELSDKLYLNPNPETTNNFNLFALFQLLIGNTDWGANSFHNVKIFTKGDVLYPVAFDFDYAGIVNANYAVVSNSFPIKKVTQRYYMGPCSSAEQFENAVNKIFKKEAAIYAAIATDSYLSKKSKSDMTDYVKDFFILLKDEEKRKVFRQMNCSKE